MKHLIIVADPSTKSLTTALTRANSAELEDLGHEQQTYDLYRIGFNPVLRAEESSPIASDRSANLDVGILQDDICSADVLTLIYPLSWMSMPATMKGFVDRVFVRGFAYDSRDGLAYGLLACRKCILITVSEAPPPRLVNSGIWNAVQVLHEPYFLRACGFELLAHLHFSGIVPNLSKSATDHCLTRVQDCVWEHCRGRPIAAPSTHFASMGP